MEKLGQFSPTSPAAKRIVAYLLSQNRHMKSAEIAQTLGLSLSTVNNYMTSLIKLGYVERVARVSDKGRGLLSTPEHES